MRTAITSFISMNSKEALLSLSLRLRSSSITTRNAATATVHEDIEYVLVELYIQKPKTTNLG